MLPVLTRRLSTFAARNGQKMLDDSTDLILDAFIPIQNLEEADTPSIFNLDQNTTSTIQEDPICQKHKKVVSLLARQTDEYLTRQGAILTTLAMTPCCNETDSIERLATLLGANNFRALSHIPLFLALNAAYSGVRVESYSPYPILSGTEHTGRGVSSLEMVFQSLVAALDEPRTRDQLVSVTGFQRRRLSSAINPLRALGLVVEPENLRAAPSGSIKAVIERDGSPNMLICRNPRQEAASLTIRVYCDYYLTLKRVREWLERGGQPIYDTRFVNERLGELLA